MPNYNNYINSSDEEEESDDEYHDCICCVEQTEFINNNMINHELRIYDDFVDNITSDIIHPILHTRMVNNFDILDRLETKMCDLLWCFRNNTIDKVIEDDDDLRHCDPVAFNHLDSGRLSCIINKVNQIQNDKYTKSLCNSLRHFKNNMEQDDYRHKKSHMYNSIEEGLGYVRGINDLLKNINKDLISPLSENCRWCGEDLNDDCECNECETTQEIDNEEYKKDVKKSMWKLLMGITDKDT